MENTKTENAVTSSRPAPAGFWLRFWAWLFDVTVLGIVVAVFSYVIYFAFGVAVVSFVLGLIERGMTGSFGALLALATLLFGWMGAILAAWFVGQALGWLYYALFESSLRRATPGKMLLALVVVDAGNSRISFLRATLRHVLKLAALFPAMLSLLFVLAGFNGGSGPGTAAKMLALSLVLAPFLFFVFYGMAGWTREKRALQDFGSGCYVVRAEALPFGRTVAVVLVIIGFFILVQGLSAAWNLYRSGRITIERAPAAERAEITAPAVALPTTTTETPVAQPPVAAAEPGDVGSTEKVSESRDADRSSVVTMDSPAQPAGTTTTSDTSSQLAFFYDIPSGPSMLSKLPASELKEVREHIDKEMTKCQDATKTFVSNYPCLSALGGDWIGDLPGPNTAVVRLSPDEYLEVVARFNAAIHSGDMAKAKCMQEGIVLTKGQLESVARATKAGRTDCQDTPALAETRRRIEREDEERRAGKRP
jgi:uncharacterized RDD family membrane protein YckC